MTRGYKGQVPESVLWVRAAEYLGMAAPHLLDRDDGIWWRSEALSLMRIEAEAREAQAKTRGGGNMRLQA